MRPANKKAPKKLRLTRESLRPLTPDALKAVKGGAEAVSDPYTALCGASL